MLGLLGAERRVCFVPDYLCDKLYISETQQYENNTVTIRGRGVKGCIYTPHIKKKPGPLFCPLCTAYSVKATLKLNLILRSSNFCYDIF